MPTFYAVDLRNAKIREFMFGAHWLLFPIICLIKLFRIPLPASTDDPPVDGLTPFEVEPEMVPAPVSEAFAPLDLELAALGFHSPIYHVIATPLQSTRVYWATYRHRNGQSYARIHHRIWTAETKPRVYLFPMIFSLLDDDTYLVTSAGKPDMIMPATIRMVNAVGAPLAELVERHDRELDRLLPSQPLPVVSEDRLRTTIEDYHGRIRDYLLQRGIFKPLPKAEQALLAVPEPVTQAHEDDSPTVVAVALDEPESPGPLSPDDAAVMVELERLQTGKTGWLGSLVLLILSLLLFVGAMKGGKIWDFIWIIIPVLAFHELGHYVAMKVFGYSNVRMFFIPFFGAAVSGRHYNVAGWKKAIVALMGPVPGIAVGAVLGIVGLILEKEGWVSAALLMMILNGFNLLPLLPLDGGWVLHSVLFARHPLLDVLFRVLAVLGLFGLGLAAGDRMLSSVGVFMAIGLPMAYRTATIARKLREEHGMTASPDARSIPPAAALTILSELRAAQPSQKHAGMLAQQVAGVFETLNARPPGVLASLGLLGVHVASFVAALVFAMLFVIGQHGNLFKSLRMAAEKPAFKFRPGATEVWRGPQAPAVPGAERVTLIATYDDEAAAKATFAALPAELPANASLRWFGQSVLLTLPEDREADRTKWLERLKQDTANVIVDRKEVRSGLRLMCLAPDGDKAKEIAELIQEFVNAPNVAYLLPPWSEAWVQLNDADRERFRKARQTVARLQKLSTEVYQRPEIKALQSEFFMDLTKLDRKEIERRSRAMNEATKKAKRQMLVELREQAAGELDMPLIQLWEDLEAIELPPNVLNENLSDLNPVQRKEVLEQHAAKERESWSEWDKKRQPVLRSMADRMGSVRFSGDKPDPEAQREVALHGHVEQNGLLLEVNLGLLHPAHGLPAFAAWLDKKGCVDFSYEFHGSPDGKEDPDIDLDLD